MVPELISRIENVREVSVRRRGKIERSRVGVFALARTGGLGQHAAVGSRTSVDGAGSVCGPGNGIAVERPLKVEVCIIGLWKGLNHPIHLIS